MRFRGTLYRAINPIYAHEPLSGKGAEAYGGRLNPRGMPALYLSLSIPTVLREVNQVGSFQPVTIVAYEADIEPIIDTRNRQALHDESVDLDLLSDAGWREAMRRDGIAPSQMIARALHATGYAGILIRSFAPGAGPEDLNIVLWSWGNTRPVRLIPIDDDRRLGRLAHS